MTSTKKLVAGTSFPLLRNTITQLAKNFFNLIYVQKFANNPFHKAIRLFRNLDDVTDGKIHPPPLIQNLPNITVSQSANNWNLSNITFAFSYVPFVCHCAFSACQTYFQGFVSPLCQKRLRMMEIGHFIACLEASSRQVLNFRNLFSFILKYLVDFDLFTKAFLTLGLKPPVYLHIDPEAKYIDFFRKI